MKPYWSDGQVTLHLGDCLDVLREMPDASVDAVVTDPPAAIGFMGKSWDGDRGSRDQWIAWLAERMEQAYRVLKPGGHALVWALPRTSGWTQIALEDAGFDVRDCILHLFGSGYPKSLDVSKAIDKAERGVPQGGADPTSPNHGLYRTQATEGKRWEGDSGRGYGAGGSRFLASTASGRTTAPGIQATPGQDAAAAEEMLAITPAATATEAAARWQGWGTALKPGQEIWWLAQKPPAQAGILDAIGSHLDRLESECRQLARSAGPSSAPTRVGSPAARTGSDPAPAVTRPADARESKTPTGPAAGSSAPTDTSPSESTAETFLSTVTSWRRCWAELCEATSTSTTGTTSSTTTDLKTLSSCLARITAESMLESPGPGSGAPSLASAADSLFAAAVLNSRGTLSLSVVASASGGTLPASPDEGAPSHSAGQEIWWLARKPLAGTVASTVLEHGTGALNIAACKVGTEPRVNNAGGSSSLQRVSRVESGYRPTVTSSEGVASEVTGRWPANIVLTHSAACELIGTRKVKGITGGTGNHAGSVYGERSNQGQPVKDYAGADGLETVEAWNCAVDCPVAELDRQSGFVQGGNRPARRGGIGYGSGAGGTNDGVAISYDSGGASRFYPVFRYQAKAPTSERPRLDDGTAHETVKPLGLMRWLCRLITPPGGTVVDLFAGSGTTGEACIIEGFRCVLIDDEEPHAELIRTRLRKDIQPTMFGAAS